MAHALLYRKYKIIRRHGCRSMIELYFAETEKIEIDLPNKSCVEINMETLPMSVKMAEEALKKAVMQHELVKTNATELKNRYREADENLTITKTAMILNGTDENKEAYATAHRHWEKLQRQWENITMDTWNDVVDAQKKVYEARRNERVQRL
jgi:hypothetical protein